MPRYRIDTLGCQMNQHDSEVMSGILERLGYEWCDRIEDADVYIINTCCVRNNPERKVYGRLGELAGLKRLRPSLVIGVCGCMVQQPGELERIRQKLPHVDLVFGTHNIHRLPELICRAQAGSKAFEVWEAPPPDPVEGVPIHRRTRVGAWVTIMYGCDNFCSYCVVPYVRGPERSRSMEAILAEVRDLVRQGYREVTLLGQNVNAYGKSAPAPATAAAPAAAPAASAAGQAASAERDGGRFGDLLAALDGVDGLLRVRFTTSHPRDFGADLVRRIAGLKKTCRHFHLPLQSGSDRILAAMNRGYTTEGFLDLCRMIRATMPGSSITTDLIVGFPGETEEDFADTLRVVEEARFDSAFTFIYSPRRGTAAERLPGQVPAAVAGERIRRLIEVQNRMSLDINRGLVGSVQEVLVEGPSEENPDVWCGRTGTNKMTLFRPEPWVQPGDLVEVRIEQARTWTLTGSLQERKDDCVPRRKAGVSG